MAPPFAVIYLSDQGELIAKKIKNVVPDCQIINPVDGIKNTISSLWESRINIICIMATGIVVRAIANHVSDKEEDPCVLSIDDQGKFATCLLGGHIGGGNELVSYVANIIGAQEVISTASDLAGNTSLDLWAKKNNLLYSSRKLLSYVSMQLVNDGFIKVFFDIEFEGELPADLIETHDINEADAIITYRSSYKEKLCFFTRKLTLGIGCNRGTSIKEIEKSFNQLIREENLAKVCFRSIGTIDLKIDEEGIIDFAKKNQLPVRFFCKDLLNSVKNISHSETVMRAVGVSGVAEPASMLCSFTDNVNVLLLPKRKWKDVTLAVALQPLVLVEK